MAIRGEVERVETVWPHGLLKVFAPFHRGLIEYRTHTHIWGPDRPLFILYLSYPLYEVIVVLTSPKGDESDHLNTLATTVIHSQLFVHNFTVRQVVL